LLTESFCKQYEVVAQLYKPGQTVAVASINGMGVRIAQDKIGVPAVSMHICPYMVRSMQQPSDMPTANLIPLLRYDPTRLSLALYYWVLDRFFADPLFGPEVNRLRCKVGLAPVRHILKWMQSPELIIGLFPRWFAEPYPADWPPQTHVSQFPLQDNPQDEELPEPLRQYLAAGGPPIVFAPGTATAHLRHFFSAAIDACARLRRRGLLLTRFRAQLPDNLPEYVHHEAYVPFSQLLPRSAALVSHGGVGSVSQGLAAGIPQLIMPLNFDQPDNARRLVSFGVARVLPPKRFLGPRVAAALDDLLNSDSVRQNCNRMQTLFPERNRAGDACNLLEAFAEGKLNSNRRF
jgi:UDP:flavonoid glycosyltransferase YjiC (YdhE family)